MKRICVFTGSTAGEDPRYLDGAHAFGELLAAEGIALVYGGSRMGMMGRMAQAALDAGGEVIGIIPGALMNREVAHQEVSELRVVESMHQRKAEMAALADAFVALPGGLGTLESFCELLTWGQLGLHRKPCGVLDVGGYYTPLVRLLDHMVREGFLATSHRQMILVESEGPRLLERLRSYEPPSLPRWIEQGQT